MIFPFTDDPMLPEQSVTSVHLAELVRAINILRSAAQLPLYPPPAIRIHMNGFVVVECIIDRTGAVRDAKVVQSSSKLFEQSALDAVQRWQFSPGTLHGQPLDTIFDLTVKFEITQ